MGGSLGSTLEGMVLGLNRQRTLERISMEGQSHRLSVIADSGTVREERFFRVDQE
jgi:hypothetical protein